MNLILPKTDDLRFFHLGRIAAETGVSTLEYNANSPLDKGVYLFPFTYREKELLPILDSLPEQSFVFIGKSTEKIRQVAAFKKLWLTAFLENDRYLTKNAEHTAEGVLAEILAKTDKRLSDLCLLIYGYGNCGRAIARLLWLCGCEIWVWSRERGKRLAEEDGFNLYPAPKLGFGMFDGVINTVPDPIFPSSLLSTIRRDASFFQVASGFSGIDPSTAEDLGFSFYPLHGLPGKYCPLSEAQILWEEMGGVLQNQRSTL